jgi:hypothetical protein
MPQIIRSARYGLAHAGDTEVYKDQAAPDTHRATPHPAVWRSVADTLAGPPDATRCTTLFPANRADWGQP